MPRYEFICDECNIFWELQILFSEYDTKKKNIKCPQCKKKKTVRQYLENKDIHGYVYQDPSTVGHQAARNTERMGKLELQSKLETDKIHRIKEQKNKQPTPWYGKLAKSKMDQIQKASGADKDKIIKKYIETGE